MNERDGIKVWLDAYAKVMDRLRQALEPFGLKTGDEILEVAVAKLNWLARIDRLQQYEPEHPAQREAMGTLAARGVTLNHLFDARRHIENAMAILKDEPPERSPEDAERLRLQHEWENSR